MLLAVVLLVGGCVGCKQESGLDKVRVCEVTHSIFYAPQYAAIALGFFEEEGIEIELSNGQGADAVMAAVLSGNMDIGFAGPEAAIYVYNEARRTIRRCLRRLPAVTGLSSLLVSRWTTLRGRICVAKTSCPVAKAVCRI